MQLNDKIFEQIDETFIHKKIVMDSCLKMAHFLHTANQDDLAIELLRRALIHDNSKLNEKELLAFSRLENKKSSLKDPNSVFDEETKQIIEIHWKSNRHHPEFFSNVNNMNEIDLIEMCCDWHARSIQYNTDLLEFARTRQENRFHFNQENFEKIIFYCEILVNS